MSLLTANLKHLYQRRLLWLLHLVLGCFVPMTVAMFLKRPVAGEGRFVGLVVLAFAVGMLAGMVQMEILIKPFAFSLPGHRLTVRRFILTVGVVSNLITCLIFLLYPGVPGGYVPVLLYSAFCAGLIFYLAGAWIAFSSAQPLAYIGFGALIVVVGQAFDLLVLLERAIVETPAVVIALGLATAGAMWLYLGKEDLARRNCLRPWMGLDVSFDPESARRFRERKAGARHWKQLKDHPRPWVQALFLGRMQRQAPFGTARFVWGSLYTSYAVAFSQWRGFLLFALFLSLFLGYTGGRMWIIVIFAPFMLLAQRRPSLYSALPIAGGRSQRLVSTLATAVVGSLLTALAIGVAVLGSIPLAAVAPDIDYRGLHLRFETIGPQVFWAVVFLPLMHAIHLIFYRRPMAIMGALMALLTCGFIITSLPGQRGLMVLSSTQNAAALAALLWMVFVGILYHVAKNRCLVR
ncbi:MAG: hypothetical protein JW993_12230 [Sedimentisphaerales bacterium]|nr:hypothetical protein [Sedimentisphaerales bacterium]